MNDDNNYQRLNVYDMINFRFTTQTDIVIRANVSKLLLLTLNSLEYAEFTKTILSCKITILPLEEIFSVYFLKITTRSN